MTLLLKENEIDSDLRERADAVSPDAATSAVVCEDVAAGSTSSEGEPGTSKSDELFAVDSLVVGVVAMAAMTVVQKGIGFVRGIAFGCWLDDGELGRWSLAISFLNLAAPLIVLGLPGTFGRYLGEFFDRGHLRAFLTRTLACASLTAAIGIGLFLGFADQASWLFFGDMNERSLVVATALALLGVLTLNTASEIFTSLRVNRLVSSMQFLHATLFALLSVGLLASGFSSAEWLIAVYGIAAALAAVPGVRLLASRWRRIPVAEDSPAWSQVGRKLAVMAFWIWIVNILANLFDAADRYVLVHFTNLSAEASQGLVGQYQSSLLLPSLLIGMGTAFGGAMLPHLARSRARGDVAGAGNLLVTATKLTVVVFVALGFAALWTGPVLFDLLWRGKFEAGENVLGLALMHGVWLSAAFLLQNWLWCAEKARFGALSFFVGLIVNVALNVALAPIFGLPGVVVATLAGDAVALMMMLVVTRRFGLRAPVALWLALTMPLSLAAGSLYGAGIFGVALALGLLFGNLIRPEEIEQVRGLVSATLARFRPASDPAA